jgi:large subunit ribosomal protein L14
MKPVSARITRGLQVGSIIRCADNTGAKILNIIAVKGYKGVKRRHPSCGVGNMIICSVRQGVPKMKKQVVHAVVIRQRKEFRRMTGMRVKFEDNAAILTNEDGEPRGTKIKGPVAKEAVERFSMIGKISKTVV